MRAAIETARLRKQRTSELAAEARYARERYDLYKARTYGPTMTSPAKLRVLKRACELSDARLRSAWTAPDPSDHEPV
jgi:hypothetical protein